MVRVEPMGTIALGPRYGRVEIVGKTTLEAEEAVTKAMHEWAHSVGVTDMESIKVQVTRPLSTGLTGYPQPAQPATRIEAPPQEQP